MAKKKKKYRKKGEMLGEYVLGKRQENFLLKKYLEFKDVSGWATVVSNEFREKYGLFFFPRSIAAKCRWLAGEGPSLKKKKNTKMEAVKKALKKSAARKNAVEEKDVSLPVPVSLPQVCPETSYEMIVDGKVVCITPDNPLGKIEVVERKVIGKL
jgi:hypothetical protein